MDSNKVVVIIGADNQTDGVFKQVGEGLSGLVEKLGGLEGILEKLAIEEVVRRLAEFVSQTLETEIALTKLSERTGVAIEDLGGLALAAQVSGVSTEGFETSLKKFATTLSNAAAGNAQANAELRSLGVSARDANGHVVSVSEALAKVADKFAATKDGADKAALSVLLFGRGGLQMVPILDKGSEGLEEMRRKADELHLTLTQADKDGLKQWEEDIGLLKAASQGLAEQFLRGLLPALDEIVHAMNDTAGGFDAIKIAGEVLGGLLKIIATVVLTIGSSFAWAGEQAAAFFGIIADAGESLDSRLKKIWTDIWDPAVSKKGAESNLADIERVAADAAKVWKQALQNKMDEQKLAEDFAKSIDQVQLQRNEALFKANLVDVQEYFDTKRRLQQDDLAAQLDAAQQQKKILQDALASAPNQEERLLVQKQINDLIEKETVLQAQLNAARGKDLGGNADELVQQAQAMEVYAAQATKLGGQINDVFAQLEEQVQAVTTAVDNYQITAIQGEARINQLRDQARTKLRGMADAYAQLALESDDTKLIANADKFEKKVDELKIHVDSLRKEAIQGLTSDTENFFKGIIDGSQTGAGAFAAFGKSLLATLAQIEAKMLAVWLIQKALGWLGSLSGGASAAPTVGDAGAIDAGGLGLGDGVFNSAGGNSLSAGDWSWVGEQGPELVRFGSDATVIPSFASKELAGGGGGDTYYQDFRGADAGVLQQVQNMIRVSEERSVARSKIEFREMSRRRVG